MKHTRLISLLCALLITAGFVSCGDNKQTSKETSQNADQSSADETTAGEYTYPEKDLDGREFTFYSPDVQFNCYIRVDFEEQSGEKLDDAVYNRNRSIENRYNCTIKEYKAPFNNEWSTGQQKMIREVTQMVMTNDSQWDAAYLPLYFQPSIINEGYFVDLNTIPTLQLGEKWWDNVINDELSVNGHIYAASSPLQFMSLDLAWVLLFNEDIMTDRGMEFPYELVRQGKWTLDEFNKMVSGAASLNGADSYNWNIESPAFYGIAAHPESPDALIFSAGNRMVTKEGGDYVFTGSTDKMFTTIDKLVTIFDKKSGNSVSGSSTLKDIGIPLYIYVFSNDNSLFLTAELKASLELRNMKSNFGLVPMPKYDEGQEKYITYVNPITCLLTIPSTNPDLEGTGVLLDVLTYESYRDCLPIYYDITVSQKGLRNEDSIEMLNIVRENRSTQMSAFYGITSELNKNLANVVTQGSGKAASIIASASNKITDNLNKFIEGLGN